MVPGKKNYSAAAKSFIQSKVDGEFQFVKPELLRFIFPSLYLESSMLSSALHFIQRRRPESVRIRKHTGTEQASSVTWHQCRVTEAKTFIYIEIHTCVVSHGSSIYRLIYQGNSLPHQWYTRKKNQDTSEDIIVYWNTLNNGIFE